MAHIELNVTLLEHHRKNGIQVCLNEGPHPFLKQKSVTEKSKYNDDIKCFYYETQDKFQSNLSFSIFW